MAISTMYPAMPGSPKTTLAADITADATSMTLVDASVLPEAPNLAVIGNGINAEVVSYTAITDSTVVSGLVRGLGGTVASAWTSGSEVARNYTSFDHDRFIANIEDLESNKISSVAWGDIGGTLADQTDLQAALTEKAPLASPALTGTPTAPTPTAGDSTTQIATTAFVSTGLSGKADAVHNHNDLYYTEDETDALLADKAAAAHTHDDRYYTETEMDTALAGKAAVSHNHNDLYYTEEEVDAALSGKAAASHNHDDRYYTELEVDNALADKSDSDHNHDNRYYTETEMDTLLSGKSDTSHTHDSRYYTKSAVDTEITNAVADKADINHAHDDRYYTETETDTLLNAKANTNHNHDSRYYTETETDTLLAAKAPLASPALTGNPTATTQSTSNDSTRIATTAFVQKHAPIHLSVTASAGSTVTKSDNRITASMYVINCVFGTPSNVTSNISWTTAAGSITFTGTFTGSTTITFDLVECNS